MTDRPRPPVRTLEEIRQLKERCEYLDERVACLDTDLRFVTNVVQRLQETVDQLMGVIECGQVPAPVFLRWDYTVTREGARQQATARFGPYTLEVIDYPNAVYWEIRAKSKVEAVGGHPNSFELALDEAEEALRRLIQEKQLRVKEESG